MPGAAIGAGLLGGAIGGGLAVTVLAPLTAANNFLGSYFFGSGMILGERQMYQDDWIKIKKRLDAGESFLVILEEVMKPNTQAIMQMARETVIAVSAEWNDIVLKYLQSIPQSIWDAINKINLGEALDDPWPLGEGIIGFVNGEVQCHSDYKKSTNGKSCILKSKPPPDGAPPPPPPPPPSHVHGPDHHGAGDQEEIPAPKETFDVSAAAQKLYNQLVTEMNKLNALRQKLLLNVNPRRSATERNRLLAALNKLRANKRNQINAMEKSYLGIKFTG